MRLIAWQGGCIGEFNHGKFTTFLVLQTLLQCWLINIVSPYSFVWEVDKPIDMNISPLKRWGGILIVSLKNMARFACSELSMCYLRFLS
mgnify:CR=1 FL=1